MAVPAADAHGPAAPPSLRQAGGVHGGRLIDRARLGKLASYSSVQVLVQAVGFVAGIVLVRAMAQAEYGHYTLAMTLVGLTVVLLDLGLSTAVLALGGAHHASATALGSLLGDAFALQWRLAAWAALPLALVGAALLSDHGLRAASAAVLVVLMLAIALLNARNALWLSVLRLRGDLRLQQRIELAVNLGRAALVIGAALVYIDATIASAALLLGSAASYAVLRNTLGRPVSERVRSSGRFTRELTSFVRRQAPNSLYYCCSGQVSVWLIGWFGDAQRLAEVGALGRLALLFAMVGSVLSALVQPYFARPRKPADLTAAFVALNAFFAALSALLVAAALVAPQALLWILGPQYQNLAPEALWLVLSSCMAAWSGAVYLLGAARGWLVPGLLVIPCGLGSIALAAALVDVSTVRGALQINTASSAVALLLVLAFVGRELLRHTRQQAAGAGV